MSQVTAIKIVVDKGNIPRQQQQTQLVTFRLFLIFDSP